MSTITKVASILPCDESFVPNRSKLFNWISFFVLGSDFVLFAFTIEILRSVDSCGLVVDSGPHPKITILRQDDAKKKLSPNPNPHLSPHQFTIDFVRFEDSPRLGFYKIRKESTRGDGLKAITNIVLGTRPPNGLHPKKNYRWFGTIFCHPAGWF